MHPASPTSSTSSSAGSDRGSTLPRAGLHFIPPGQRWPKAYIESFNSGVRDGCLNINMFWSLAQARVLISDWRTDWKHLCHVPWVGVAVPYCGRPAGR